MERIGTVFTQLSSYNNEMAIVIHVKKEDVPFASELTVIINKWLKENYNCSSNIVSFKRD